LPDFSDIFDLIVSLTFLFHNRANAEESKVPNIINFYFHIFILYAYTIITTKIALTFLVQSCILFLVVVLRKLEGPVAEGAHAWAPFFTILEYTPSGKYLYGVTFEEITAFYYFDEELRTLFLKYILHIERHLKSLISYYFCEKFGESQTEYLNSNNFNSAKKNQKAVHRLITSLEKAISLPTHYNYIVHYAKNYHNVPLWVAMNAITFGQLSAFYQYMPNKIQSKVSKHFPGYSEKQLHQFITIVAKCRNVCAHRERLFDFRTSDTIPDTLLHKKLNIPMKKGSYLFGKHDLFAVVLSLRYLIGNDEFKKFKASLSWLILQVLKQCPHITKTQF